MPSRKQTIRKLFEPVDGEGNQIEVRSSRDFVHLIVWSEVDTDAQVFEYLDAATAKALASQLWHHAKLVEGGKNG